MSYSGNPLHPAAQHSGTLPPYFGQQQQLQQLQQQQQYGQYPTPGWQNPPYNAVISTGNNNNHQQLQHMQQQTYPPQQYQQLQQQLMHQQLQQNPSSNLPPPPVFHSYHHQQPYYPSYPPSVESHHHQQQQQQHHLQQQQFYPPPQQQQQPYQNQIQQQHPPPPSNYPFTSPHQFALIPPPLPPTNNIIHQQLPPPLPSNSTMPPPPPAPPFAAVTPTPTLTMQPTIITAQPIFIRPPPTNTSFSAPSQPRVFTHTPVQVDLTKVTVGKMADIAKVSLSRQNNEVVGVVSSNSISKSQPSSYSTIDTINILPSHIPHIEPGRLDVRIHDFYSKYNELIAEREGHLSLGAAGNY